MTTWLYQITRRVAANARRRAWLRRWVGGGGAIDSGALVHERPADVAYELAARRCLERMPRRQAEVLVMIELVGLTREECAQILGVPTGTVASRMRRARASFRKHWDKSRAPLAGRRLEETR
jgi:RNA polymerase sigma-70 factor (ECF subfamily)